MSEQTLDRNPAVVLSFEEFWSWLQLHFNCILRVASPDIALYDAEDFHWHFAIENEEVLLLQIIRGKQLIGELAVRPAEVATVHGSSMNDEGEEFAFDLLDSEQRLICQICTVHGYEEAVETAAHIGGTLGRYH